MDRTNDKKSEAEFFQIQKLIGEQKFGEAINRLKKITARDYNYLKAKTFLEYLEKIMEYHNRDIFSSTNLNMDPWFE